MAPHFRRLGHSMVGPYFSEQRFVAYIIMHNESSDKIANLSNHLAEKSNLSPSHVVLLPRSIYTGSYCRSLPQATNTPQA